MLHRDGLQALQRRVHGLHVTLGQRDHQSGWLLYNVLLPVQCDMHVCKTVCAGATS